MFYQSRTLQKIAPKRQFIQGVEWIPTETDRKRKHKKADEDRREARQAKRFDYSTIYTIH